MIKRIQLPERGPLSGRRYSVVDSAARHMVCTVVAVYVPVMIADPISAAMPPIPSGERLLRAVPLWDAKPLRGYGSAWPYVSAMLPKAALDEADFFILGWYTPSKSGEYAWSRAEIVHPDAAAIAESLSLV